MYDLIENENEQIEVETLISILEKYGIVEWPV